MSILLEIARYYVESDLSKAIKDDDDLIKIHNFLNTIKESTCWNLCRLISYEYRKNAVYSKLTDSSYEWSKETIHVSDIRLGSINDRVKPLLEEANYDALKFTGLLKKQTDKRILEEFNPRKVSEQFSFYIFEFNGEKMQIIDGTHRLVSEIQLGVTKVKGYIGRKKLT